MAAGRLSLSDAIAEGRLTELVEQEEARGIKPVDPKALEKALTRGHQTEAIKRSKIAFCISRWFEMTNRPNGTLYVGVASNLAKRVWEHREGEVAAFTRRYGLKRLVYAEYHDDIRTAIQREHNLKHWSRARKVALILAENPAWDDLCGRLA